MPSALGATWDVSLGVDKGCDRDAGTRRPGGQSGQRPSEEMGEGVARDPPDRGVGQGLSEAPVAAAPHDLPEVGFRSDFSLT